MNARETMEALMAGRTVRGSNGCMYMLDPEGNLLVFYSNGDIGPALSFDPMLDYEAVKRESAPEVIIEDREGGPWRFTSARSATPAWGVHSLPARATARTAIPPTSLQDAA